MWIKKSTTTCKSKGVCIRHENKRDYDPLQNFIMFLRMVDTVHENVLVGYTNEKKKKKRTLHAIESVLKQRLYYFIIGNSNWTE